MCKCVLVSCHQVHTDQSACRAYRVRGNSISGAERANDDGDDNRCCSNSFDRVADRNRMDCLGSGLRANGPLPYAQVESRSMCEDHKIQSRDQTARSHLILDNCSDFFCTCIQHLIGD